MVEGMLHSLLFRGRKIDEISNEELYEADRIFHSRKLFTYGRTGDDDSEIWSKLNREFLRRGLELPIYALDS